MTVPRSRSVHHIGLVTTVLVAGIVLSACSGEGSTHTSTYLDAINAARAHARDCGDTHFQAAPPLTWNAKLGAAAQEHSDDMARNDFMGHEGSDGSTPDERIERHGYHYRSWGENVAAGQLDTRAVVQRWLESPGHCKNIMNAKITEMGMALTENKGSEYRQYWTVDFGAR